MEASFIGFERCATLDLATLGRDVHAGQREAAARMTTAATP